MSITVKTRGISKFKNYDGTQFIFALTPSYQYKTIVLAYDEFDFIVDTGSSLGLWIGKD
jgi:hypothetical protein